MRLHRASTALAFALLFAVVLGGCETTTGGKGGRFCDVAEPMTPEPGDSEKISIKLGRQVVAHNRFGAATCGWKP